MKSFIYFVVASHVFCLKCILAMNKFKTNVNKTTHRKVEMFKNV